MLKYQGETYLNTEEAAEFLGKTSTAFRQFFYRSKLPRRKVGGRLYFAEKDLQGIFATARHTHFEATGLTYDEVYTLDQLLDIFLTTKQYIYSFVKQNKIRRYKDNTGKTLFDKSDMETAFKGLEGGVDDL